MATAKTPAVTLRSVGAMLDEVAEYYARYAKLLDRLRRTRQGSEAYVRMLSDLWVELVTLEQKAKHAAMAIDEYQESLPEVD
jgi:hypothetical protein